VQKLIRSIFLYLDRSYLFSSTSQQSIEALGMELFKRHVVTNKNLISRLLDGIFALLAQDRQNNDEDVAKSNVLSSCVRMISSLGIYATKFDPQFIAVSRAHYAKLAQSKPKIHDLRAYLMYVADQVQKEAKRCDRFHLEQYTKREVVAVVEHEMVRQKKMLLADNKLVGHVLKSSDFVSLQILYRLLERVALVGEILKPAWAAYINDEGLKIINDEQLTNDMIPRLLDFKNGLESIWSGPWNVNKPLGYVLRESFSAFINEGSDGNGSRGGARTAEMLAKYLDILLRQGVRGLPSNVGDTRDNKSEDSIDDDAMLSRRLESVLDLFRFIHRKDVFEAFYKKDLAKRLLTGRSASVDTEWLMLTKLKTGR
jgi:cullin-4